MDYLLEMYIGRFQIIGILFGSGKNVKLIKLVIGKRERITIILTWAKEVLL